MKRAIISIFAIVVIIACLGAALPFVLSSETVRNGITSRIEALTGKEVTFQGNPSLSISPFLGFEISDLELVDPTKDIKKTPFLKVEKVTAQLNLLPALTGNVEITEYKLLRPKFFLKTQSDETANWKFSKGGLKDAIQAAFSNRDEQTSKPIPQSSIGELLITDGILIYEDDTTKTSQTITSMNGRMSWPDINSELEISGNAIWRGEGITINSNFKNPIEILSGGESPVSVDLNSQPLSLEFTGQANMLSNLFVQGNLSAKTPSISRLAEVLEIDIGEFNSFEQWSATGKFEATANSTNLSDASFVIGESLATGVVRLSKNEANQSKLDGTLAFETIDLSSDFGISQQTNQRFNPRFVEGLNVDLRISATSMGVNGLNLDNVAAAIIVDEKGWTFDIGDASTFNGKLTAKLGERLADKKTQAFLEISTTDMDAESITKIIGKKPIRLNGKTSFVANLRTNNLKDSFFNSGLNGSFSGKFNAGNIVGINLPKLFSSNVQETELQFKGFNENQNTDFQTMNLKLFFNDGAVAISKSKIDIDDELHLQVFGDVNFNKNELDLQLQEITKDGPKERRIFLKGTLLKPLLEIKNNAPPINQN